MSGSFAQNSNIFKSNSNKQCTAMSMIAIIQSYLINCKLWSTSIIDLILIKGDIYYQKCYTNLIGNKNNHLSIEEVVGRITINDTIFDTSWIYNPRLCTSKLNIHERILQFLNSNNTHALIITGILSFGLINENDCLYFFDSHARSPQGKSSSIGKACIIKFAGDNKINNIVDHIMKFVNKDNITIEINDVICIKLITETIVVIMFILLKNN